MATYKVIQDIEAEDKLIGWMTPRQAIYATIVIISAALIFVFATKGVWWLGIPLLPHMILFTILAGPFVHDQPSEVWLLAKIRFSLVPRRRIWNQSGVSEMVTITVPKKVEKVLTDGLSQNEVKSRLKALASTIDSRGWAVKNINVNLYGQSYVQQSNDRLINTNAFPQQVPDIDVLAQDDILDERSNPTAQNLDMMINQSTAQHREQLVAMMQQKSTAIASHPADQNWFHEPVNDTYEEAAKATISAHKQRPDPTKSRMRTISPQGVRQAPVQAKPPEPPVVTDRVAEQLSQDNNSMIDKLARDAKRLKEGDDEVVISLH